MAVNGHSVSNGVNEHHTSNGDSSYPVAFPALAPLMKKIYKPGQMYSYQSKLLKRPVPPLQQTLTKYLKSLEVSDTSVCVCVHICFILDIILSEDNWVLKIVQMLSGFC